jgi:hypothetical protein
MIDNLPLAKHCTSKIIGNNRFFYIGMISDKSTQSYKKLESVCQSICKHGGLTFTEVIENISTGEVNYLLWSYPNYVTGAKEL